MERETITSVHNAKVRRYLLLQQKSSERRQSGCFVLEGRRELHHALSAGYKIDTLFVCRPLSGEQFLSEKCPPGANVVDVTPAVYSRMAYRESTEGCAAILRSRERRLTDLSLSSRPLLMVLESVEKPGNLGAILRSADAAAADAVIVCDPLTDLYNPNLIRSSVGAFFTVPCVACTSEECISFLKSRGIQILTAQLQDSVPYYASDMSRGTAIVMGTESTGLTTQWRQAADTHIRIPMQGRIDSLNVSVSAAILLFEAVRQRV